MAVGGYELRERIGEGAFGTVYKAFQPSVGREVAIKIVRREFADHPEFVRRFEAEAQIIARLEHPHIVPLHDYWRDDDGAYLVMRLLSGGSLQQALDRGPWKPVRAVELLDQIGSALAVAHRQGVIHRDIKPANILLDTDSNGYLSDFGIAKEVFATTELTRSGGAPGTPAYMAPEQLRGEPVGPHTDVFSLGMVLYELVTGEHPFPEVSLAELVQKRLTEPLPSVRDLRPDLPVAIDDVVQKATAKDPADRYSDVSGLVTDLQGAVELPTEGMAPPRVGADGVDNNLPADITSFVGREQELAEIDKLLRGTRMVTLTGVGGAGKSRLAVEAARQVLDEYPDGVWITELGSLSNESLVAQQVAAALGVKEQPGLSLTDSIARYLDNKGLLVLLDNCEHVLDASAQLAEASVRSGGGVRVLATSRETLGVPGEVTYPVPPLPTPDPDHLPAIERITTYGAVRLFAERGELANPDFRLGAGNAETVARICQTLDGIPLAIELAAARLKMLPVDQVADRLEDRFAILTGGQRTAPARQRTLEATMEWSYDLLTDQEQALFRRLSVFRGGFTIEAAERVGHSEQLPQTEILPLLARLIDTSMVLPGGQTARYRMLETVRQYANDRLTEEGDAEETQRRHALFYLTFAREEESKFQGPEELAAFQRLAGERDNLRAALQWSLDSDQAEIGLDLAGLLAWFWYTTGDFREAGRWLETFLAAAPNAPAEVRAPALRGAGSVSSHAERSLGYFREEEKLRRQIGDTRGLIRVLNNLGTFLDSQGRWDEAADFLRQAFALGQSIGRPNPVAVSNLGWNALARGNQQQAEEWFGEAVTHAHEAGRRLEETFGKNGQAWVAGLEGDPKGATELLEKSLPIQSKFDAKGHIAVTHRCIAWWARILGDTERAAASIKESLRLGREAGHATDRADAFLVAATTETARGNHHRAARLVGAGDQLHKAFGTVPKGWMQAGFDENRAELRSTLGEQAFDQALAEGAAMTLDEAVAYALGETGEPATS